MRKLALLSVAAALLGCAATAHAALASSPGGIGAGNTPEYLSRSVNADPFAPSSWLAANGTISSMPEAGLARPDGIVVHGNAKNVQSGVVSVRVGTAHVDSAVKAPGHGAGPATALSEPETYGMLLAGLALMGFVARRRQGDDQA